MSLRDRTSLALGAAGLLTSVLVVGGALRWTQALVAGLFALALGVQLLARRRLDRVSPLIVLPAVAAVLCLVQLIPLPAGLLGALDNTGQQLRADGAAIAQTAPWQSLSLDPAGTLRALAFFITLMGVAVLATRFAASERGRFALLAAVAATCGLAALVTGVHTLVGADSLYGLYTPSHAGGGPVFGPLLNPNHMGGLMGIGAVLSIGLAFYHRQPTQLRVLWIVSGLGCVIVAAASLSRGAMIGMVIGFVVVIAVLVGKRLSTREHHRGRALRRDLPVAIVIGLGLAVALYVSAGNVAEQVGTTSLNELNRPISKYAAWKSSVALVKETPWAGVGRGAIEPTLTRVYPASAQYTFSHLENEYLTAVVEWGLPGAAILAAVFGWFILTAMRRRNDGPLAAAALGALAMIMFQSSVDFGIELLGIAVPVTIIAATVALVPLRPAASQFPLRIQRALLIALLGVAALVLLTPATTSVQEDHDAILAHPVPTLADIRPSIERHPLDYFGFGEAADLLSRAGDPKAAEYLNQSMRLHPSHPGLHRLVARMLVGLKKFPQAALEYSYAMRTQAAPRRMLEEVLLLVPNPDDVAASIPVDYPNIDVMLHVLSDLKRNDIAEKWLERVAARPQHDLRVIDTLYSLAMTRKDFDVAGRAAELRTKVSRTTTSRLMLAKVRYQLKQYDPLLKELGDVRRWTGRLDQKAQGWLLLCDVEIDRKEWDPALECLHRLDASGLPTVSHPEITKRIHTVEESRTYESKMQAIKALEASMAKPGTTPQPAAPKVPPITLHARVVMGSTWFDIATTGDPDTARALCNTLVERHLKVPGVDLPGKLVRKCDLPALPVIEHDRGFVIARRHELDDVDIMMQTHARATSGTTATIDELDVFTTAARCEEVRQRLLDATTRSVKDAATSAQAALAHALDDAKKARDGACVGTAAADDACSNARAKVEILERATARSAPAAPPEQIPPCRPE